jgi:hypothetical protein
MLVDETAEGIAVRVSEPERSVLICVRVKTTSLPQI